ncbi:Tetratricopeptide repeat-containing protein [Halopseudomonas litoralis]|uniref:Tetratricopeptide repeat-containing protein n=1 Tax=Halopseudomonas litoralis TaxID=797277 RepID=A0A1H1WSH9_9GAMM|nr:tetratricopeptide repeat-containing response regulator [Halopseudomonas litoralis]SDT00187.1 Tetratricopeptide repeat-containing protein [Halopseudomonas litoralis]
MAANRRSIEPGRDMIEYNTKRFLIVDDFTDFRSALTGMLRQLGVADVDAAVSGEEALALCRKKSYDVILHDYNLGKGKNGQQVLEELHHDQLISPHCIFIIISAESSQAMVMAALECEPDSYLTKPFNLASLQQRLDKLIAMKTALRPVLEAEIRGEHVAVLEACAKIIAAHPRYAPQCRRHQVSALAALGRQPDQERLLQSLVSERPLPWALVALADLWRETGKLDKAHALYQDGIRQFPMIPALYDGLAATELARGNLEEAQQHLQHGLRVSPNSLQRQERMGQIAQRNNDHEQATRAFRHAVDLGRNSLFRNPENHLSLASSLTAQAGDTVLGPRALAEVHQTLSELDKTWRSDPALSVRSRLQQASTLDKAGQVAQAYKLAEQVASEIAELDSFFAADVALQAAQQLRGLGQAQQADGVLATCAEMYGDDPAVLANIARHTDNPDILAAGSQALEWNRQAIQFYQQKNYSKALELFRQALASQPRNISFALNTAQSLLRLVVASPKPELLAECERCLQQAATMPTNDHRRERYRKLRERLEQL